MMNTDSNRKIKTKRKPLPMGYPYGIIDVIFSIFELIRSIRKPKIMLSLSIDSEPKLYSIVDDHSLNTDTESKFYLCFSIQPKIKEIGNLNVQTVMQFKMDNTMHSQSIIFENIPEVVEQNEEIILKSNTKLDLSLITNIQPKINITLYYDYQITDKIRTGQITSTWCFSVDNGRLISNSLLRLK